MKPRAPGLVLGLGLSASIAACAGALGAGGDYELADGGGAASTTSSSSTSSSSSASSSSSSSGKGGAGGATSSSSSSSSSTTTSSSSTSASSSSTGGGGGPSASCWASSPTVWPSVVMLDPTTIGGLNPSDLDVSPDGLTLTYTSGPDLTRRPYQAVRADRTKPFTGGAVVAPWPNLAGSVGHPWIDLDGTELVVSTTTGLSVSVHKPAGWLDPVSLGPSVNAPPASAGNDTIAVDGTLMIFERNDGPTNMFAGNIWRFYSAARPAPVTAGSFFGNAVAVALPPITDQDELICPVLSPDGTRLFFGTSYPYVIDAANLGHVVTVWYATRVGNGWSAPIHLSVFDSPTLETCPASVTADGCELYVNRFSLTDATVNQIVVAKRTP